jgi:hypothetical protein
MHLDVNYLFNRLHRGKHFQSILISISYKKIPSLKDIVYQVHNLIVTNLILRSHWVGILRSLFTDYTDNI